jgi:hypothetical protein
MLSESRLELYTVTEWVQLYDKDEQTDVYVNMAHACSVYPNPEDGMASI